MNCSRCKHISYMCTCPSGSRGPGTSYKQTYIGTQFDPSTGKTDAWFIGGGGTNTFDKYIERYPKSGMPVAFQPYSMKDTSTQTRYTQSANKYTSTKSTSSFTTTPSSSQGWTWEIPDRMSSNNKDGGNKYTSTKPASSFTTTPSSSQGWTWEIPERMSSNNKDGTKGSGWKSGSSSNKDDRNRCFKPEDSCSPNKKYKQ